jgi:hypothetical protein
MKQIEVTQEQFDYLKTIRPHFCVPAYSGIMNEGFFMSFVKLINLFNLSGIHYSLDTIVNESLVTRARNSLVAKMMQFEGQSTHLVFIDADIEFDAASVLKLLIAQKDVVGGIYPKKTLPIDYVVNPIENAKLDGALLEVKRIGTGFICVKREVFEKMFDYYKHLKYNDNIGLEEKYAPFKYALFDTSIDQNDNNNYLSEDYTFCDRWRAMGGQIWADLSINLNHLGHYKFKGISPLQALQVAAAQKKQENQEQEIESESVVSEEGINEENNISENLPPELSNVEQVKSTLPVIGH